MPREKSIFTILVITVVEAIIEITRWAIN